LRAKPGVLIGMHNIGVVLVDFHWMSGIPGISDWAFNDTIFCNFAGISGLCGIFWSFLYITYLNIEAFKSLKFSVIS
jgi:hypothetical protein